ncbi:SUMF1/EgtB/PvdO family nonheme iron enzyme [Roseateles sp. P5_D6]
MSVPASIFLSHSHKDKPFVRRLAADLQAHGVRVWVDEAEMMIGDSLVAKIGEALETMSFVGAVLSVHSVKSPWVTRELDIAINHEIAGRRVKVLPLVIDDCSLPTFLAGKLYGDFRDFARYQDSFEHLMQRLRAPAAAPSPTADISQRTSTGPRKVGDAPSEIGLVTALNQMRRLSMGRLGIATLVGVIGLAAVVGVMKSGSPVRQKLPGEDKTPGLASAASAVPVPSSPPAAFPEPRRQARAEPSPSEPSNRTEASTDVAPSATSETKRQLPVSPTKLTEMPPAFADAPRLVVLPKGSYMMGSPQTERGRSGGSETSPTRVDIRHIMAVGATEVTVGQFKRFMDARPQHKVLSAACGAWSESLGNWSNVGFEQSADHPVVCVSYDLVQQYIGWLNDEAGIRQDAIDRFRLPHEFEWEYAARAVTSASDQHWRFYWGDDHEPQEWCKYANARSSIQSMKFCPRHRGTTEVRHLLPNAFGLFDMAGNAREWTRDCLKLTKFQPKASREGMPSTIYIATNSASASSGVCQENGKSRMVRGGSWDGVVNMLRSASRSYVDRDTARNDLGFRVVRTLSTQ